MKTRILTESEYHANLLRLAIGPRGYDNLEITPRRGLSSAASAASTLLSRRDQNVILVIDSDPTRYSTAVEFIKELVGQDSARFRLIQMAPEIESLFFQDKQALENALGGEISNIVWKIGQSAPKSTLSALLGEKKKKMEELLASKDLIASMYKSPRIQEILDFAHVAHA
jgi:hypothetical protein